MDELDPRVAALIELGRDAHDPTEEDETRVRAALAAAIAGAGGTSEPAGDGAGGVSSTAVASSSVKWWIGVALVGGGLGMFSMLARPEPVRDRGFPPDHSPAERPASAANTSSPAAVVPPAAIEPEPSEQTTAPARRAQARPRAASQPKPAQHLSNGPDELALIRDATRALSDGRSADALSLLAQHERSYPTGVLAEERRGLRVLVLCALGRVAEGRTERARFLERSPASPLAGRVKAACAQDGE